jgi:hypothetical protein
LSGFSKELTSMIHSLIAGISFIIGVSILLITIKFIAAYFLVYYNHSFILESGIDDIRIIFIAPLLIFFISIIIMKISFTVLKINFKIFLKRYELDKSEKSIFTYRDGINL